MTPEHKITWLTALIDSADARIEIEQEGRDLLLEQLEILKRQNPPSQLEIGFDEAAAARHRDLAIIMYSSNKGE